MDPQTFIQAVALVLALAALIVLLRVIVPDGVDGGNLFVSDSDLRWPRGVQEEEPIRWRVELISTLGSHGRTSEIEPRARRLVRRIEQRA
jgi:hypothetical protein